MIIVTPQKKLERPLILAAEHIDPAHYSMGGKV